MPFLLIKGTFKPSTGVPDGDTVRFAPDNPNLLFQLQQMGFPPNLNENNGTIAIRYEGIDALEKEVRHPESANATTKNLELLGLGSPQDEGRGYVLAGSWSCTVGPFASCFRATQLNPTETAFL